jgi:hypothetical protein
MCASGLRAMRVLTSWFRLLLIVGQVLLGQLVKRSSEKTMT